MTTFLRLLSDKDKALSLQSTCHAFRNEISDARIFQVDPDSFRAIPGAPFAYWVSKAVHSTFQSFPALHTPNRRYVCSTNPLNDDFRYVRLWWEAPTTRDDPCWKPWAKGGAFSKYYYDIHTVIHWHHSRATYYGFLGTANRPLERPASVQYFFRPGLTWPRRTNGLSLRVMPKGCIFADKGPAIYVTDDTAEALLALLAMVNSQAFNLLVSVQLARTELAQSFEVGLIQQTPIPDLTVFQQAKLAAFAHRAWSLKRNLDTVEEASHAFLLPAPLRNRVSDFVPLVIETNLAEIEGEINAIAFQLYRFAEADQAVAQVGSTHEVRLSQADDDDVDGEEEVSGAPVVQTAGLLSWSVGVAFGRFDWRLATGERFAPPEPDPFDPLPAKSPGMLPGGDEPFHLYAGILVDDAGHKHDLAQLIEEVLTHVDMAIPPDVRHWLQREFFPFHLQRYSKSRRKAPVYWPLATASGGYTLWLYYPDLNSQTLYTAINEFVEPKLEQVGKELAGLHNKGSARSRDDDKAMEALQTLDKELVELRDTLLRTAPTYRPNHDDGVQIAAAPLWPLFRHKPWQKLLKETWEKLKKGDYDWSHLAMAYWPDRVRENCKTDKSLAIAHGLEELYEPPPESGTGANRGGRNRRGAAP